MKERGVMVFPLDDRGGFCFLWERNQLCWSLFIWDWRFSVVFSPLC